MEERYIACMILHAVGDTVGFKNGEWEFKQGGYDKTLEKVYEFIDLGGINHLCLKNWRVSDDTIMHIQTAASILNDFTTMNSLGIVLGSGTEFELSDKITGIIKGNITFYDNAANSTGILGGVKYRF